MSIIFSTKVQKYKTVAEANPLLREIFFTMVFLHFGEVFHIRPRNGNIISLSYVIDAKNFLVHLIHFGAITFLGTVPHAT